mmetsp:Transcript_87737/g.204159  ORF Transcript_87737/g.204159 Transcript_87737/m.204159 type:complete len:154 (+) Transcript_87737:81-542(+)
MLASTVRAITRPRIAAAAIPAASWRFHCQVPCGIFTDDLRVKAMMEDAQTIRKSVVQISELYKANSLQDMHQLVRWVATKEEHASQVMGTISEYFLAQRVKKELLSEPEYFKSLAAHHAVMVAAMKAKQSSELGPVDALDAALKELEPLYAPK